MKWNPQGAANSNQRAGEHREDMKLGREDRDKQSAVEGYGGGPIASRGAKRIKADSELSIFAGKKLEH